jgi:hypothetical protein
LTGLAALTILVAAAVVYMQATVPIAGPDLARADAVHYWQVAVIAGLVVLVATAGVAWLCLRAWRRSE